MLPTNEIPEMAVQVNTYQFAENNFSVSKALDSWVKSLLKSVYYILQVCGFSEEPNFQTADWAGSEGKSSAGHWGGYTHNTGDTWGQRTFIRFCGKVLSLQNVIGLRVCPQGRMPKRTRPQYAAGCRTDPLLRHKSGVELQPSCRLVTVHVGHHSTTRVSKKHYKDNFLRGLCTIRSRNLNCMFE